MVVPSIDPQLPSYKQVQQIQDRINERLSGQFPGLELQMQVQRMDVSVVKGNKVNEEAQLEQLFNKADTAISPMQVPED